MSSWLSTVTTGKEVKPHLVLIYGKEGVGKSTFGSEAPNPIFLALEDGTGEINTSRGVIASTDMLKQALRELISEKHGFQTIVLDTLDALETIIHREIVKADSKAKSIESAAGGYGKGFGVALTMFNEIIDLLEEARKKRGLNVILIAHDRVYDFHDPRLQESYKVYDIKLHQKASDRFKEYVDAVLFATTDDDALTNSDDKLTVTSLSEDNIIHTRAAPGWSAKNRFGLPKKMKLNWTDYDLAVRTSRAGDKEAVLGDIEGLLLRVPDETREKVVESIAKAGENVSQLVRILDRLKIITAPTEG